MRYSALRVTAPTGLGDGPVARALSKLPPEIGSFAWQAERHDAQLATAIRDGVPGTPMPAGRMLTDGDVTSAVAYLRQLTLREVPARANGVAGAQRDPDAVLRHVMRGLDEALAAARAGRTSDASDRAFDAYIAFEPIETPARAKNPGLRGLDGATVRRLQGRGQASDVLRGPSARATRSRPGCRTWSSSRRVRRAAGGSAFLQSFLIILREGLEAILVDRRDRRVPDQDRPSRAAALHLDRRRAGARARAP